MNKAFMDKKTDISEIMESKDCVTYEHAGYRIRVHFCGNKTLLQCVKNLTERKMEG